VTLYAVCLFLSSAGLILLAVMDLLNTRRAWADRHVVVIVLALALILFLVGRGLWRLENWARLFIVALHTLATLGLLLSMSQALLAPGRYSGQVITSWALCAAGVPLLFVAGIALWFTINGKHFY
jgi:hypothetical protein